jgi:ATP-dependent Clp protease ATP-binding subunit ClpA
MHSRIGSIISILVTTLLAASLWAQSSTGLDPDLNVLKDSGFIMGPGSSSYPVSDSWKKPTNFMKSVDTFDSVADHIESIVCGEEQNKSVLIIGEPSLAYMYLFARMAGPRPNSKCPPNMWHVELNVSKVESGHRYVGEVDEYWQDRVLAPSDKKNVILYLSAIGGLVGIGSHSNDETGIEREYVANITSGRLRSIAFMDKYEYNEMSRSRNAYVLEAFADRVVLPPIDSAETYKIAWNYLKVIYPNLKIADRDLQFIIKNIGYYQPNRNEPDRTLSVINALVRGSGNMRESKPEMLAITVESEHPYPINVRKEFIIEQPNYNALQIEFESFDLESNYDFLEIYDANDNDVLLARISGKLSNGTRFGFYGTNKLKLVLISDNSGQNQGFKISRIYAKTIETHTFTREEVRKAVLTVAQVPQWFVDRDYSVIKNLEANLNGDVVGVAEGKKDLVRLAKNGYVAGRTDDKPIATALLAGPTGTGKSYIAKKMADFMQMKLITIDMTSYKDVSSFRTFQEVMARNLTNTPYAVYLFEEIDKASIEVLDQLYFMMDEGVFYDPYQRPLFARGAFILMTTNAASDTILHDPNNPNLRALVMADLKKNFRMSFLNRFDAISIFKPFTDAEFHQLAGILVSKKIAKIKETFEWTMTVDPGTLNFLAIFGRSPEFGARPMERLVENTLGIGIAEFQLANGFIPEQSLVQLTKLAEPNKFRINVNGQALDYMVDPSNNGRIFSLGRGFGSHSIEKFFRAIRLYND